MPGRRTVSRRSRGRASALARRSALPAPLARPIARRLLAAAGIAVAGWLLGISGHAHAHADAASVPRPHGAPPGPRVDVHHAAPGTRVDTAAPGAEVDAAAPDGGVGRAARHTGDDSAARGAQVNGAAPGAPVNGRLHAAAFAPTVPPVRGIASAPGGPSLRGLAVVPARPSPRTVAFVPGRSDIDGASPGRCSRAIPDAPADLPFRSVAVVPARPPSPAKAVAAMAPPPRASPPAPVHFSARVCLPARPRLSSFTVPSHAGGSFDESRSPRAAPWSGGSARTAPVNPQVPVPRPLPRRVKVLPPSAGAVGGPTAFWRPAGFAAWGSPPAVTAPPRPLPAPVGGAAGEPSFSPD